MAQLLSRTPMLHLNELKLSKGMYVYLSVCAYVHVLHIITVLVHTLINF